VLVENTDARIDIANPSLRKATALDTNGLPMDIDVAVERRDGRLHVTLPPDALYTVIQ
jgi:hypothetical protein